VSRSQKNNMKLAAELVSKGATMLSEPCPQCGGIQVRYRGKVYCTNHDDLSTVGSPEVVSMETVVPRVREVLLARLNEAAVALGNERDATQQDRLISLMAKYFELLQKLPPK
jgi:UPF0148 protein